MVGLIPMLNSTRTQRKQQKQNCSEGKFDCTFLYDVGEVGDVVVEGADGSGHVELKAENAKLLIIEPATILEIRTV